MFATIPVLRSIGHLAKKLIPTLTIALAFLSTTTAHANNPPTIQSFAIDYLGGGWWELYGVVSDEDPEYCEVFFTGLLDGYSVDVSSNGEFDLIVQVPSGVSGVVEASALDPEYEWSDTASDYLDSNN